MKVNHGSVSAKEMLEHYSGAALKKLERCLPEENNRIVHIYKIWGYM